MKNSLLLISLFITGMLWFNCGQTERNSAGTGNTDSTKAVRGSSDIDTAGLLSPIKLKGESRNDTVSNPAFGTIERLINSSINDSAFPGAVLLVWKDGKIIFEKPFGRLTYNDSSAEVTTNTIFDLASLTKVIAAATAAMICVDRKLFSINDKVSKYIPAFAQNGKENVTIKNLLMHNSGLPAYKKFYALYTDPQQVLDDIYASRPAYPPGTKTLYSDLGMITLGKVIEKVTGKSLDVFCNENIFKPLGMKDTYYNPPEALRHRIAPTEFDHYWRKRLLIGEVHDETASLLNGVSGHAGLFSTAGDISRVLQMLLQKGMYEGKRIVDSAVVSMFLTRQPNGRALGWDMKSPEGSSAGSLFSDRSYGHTGFTGTSVWTDPVRRLFVVFLTNRVYPSRTNNKLIKIRPELHNDIIRSIER